MSQETAPVAAREPLHVTLWRELPLAEHVAARAAMLLDLHADPHNEPLRAAFCRLFGSEPVIDESVR